MATINASQDYDQIYTLTFASGSGTCNIRLYRGSSTATSATVYYRAGTSGSWTSLWVVDTTTTFPVSSTTMQVGLNWDKSGNNYMTPSFYGQSTNLTGIAISQKAALTGTIGDYFMYNFAYGCAALTSLDIPDISEVTSAGIYFMAYYAYGCASLTSLGVPDTSHITTAGIYFMAYYARGCTSLTSLEAPNTSHITTAGDCFMANYARGCTSLTSLEAPNTSHITTAGIYFMANYARDCTSLTSLGVPDTSSLTTCGISMMDSYATSCNKLTRLNLPAAGWFATHNVNWFVPSGRLNNLYGYARTKTNLDAWKALVTSGNTLYTNYIRSASYVKQENSLTLSRTSPASHSSGADVYKLMPSGGMQRKIMNQLLYHSGDY